MMKDNPSVFALVLDGWGNGVRTVSIMLRDKNMVTQDDLSINCGFKRDCSDYPQRCYNCKFNHKRSSYYQILEG
jgi:hypothetical protein